MNVVLTDDAIADLEAIADTIAQDNPPRARSFVAELLDKARDLANFPNRFPLVPRYADRGVRRRLYGHYLIFYRTEPDHISVIHILHGARDYDPLLFPDEE